MPPKKTSKNSEEVVATPVVVTPVVATAVVAPVKTKKVASEKKTKEATAPKVTEKKAKEPSAPKAKKTTTTEKKAAASSEKKVPAEKKPRVKPTKESLVAEVDTMLASVDKEVEEVRSSDKKTRGSARYLVSHRKQLNDFKKRLVRVFRLRVKTSNPNAGFTRPVEISVDLRKFLETVDPTKKGQTVSRVDVTRTINKFIKEKELQNPNDRKIILWDKNPDLKKLFVGVTATDIVTYFSIHKFLKNHFMKANPPVSTATSIPSTTVKTK